MGMAKPHPVGAAFGEEKQIPFGNDKQEWQTEKEMMRYALRDFRSMTKRYLTSPLMTRS